MSDIFNTSQFTQVPHNIFDLSHEHKTTMRFGQLYPVLVEEVLPGDNFKMQTTKLTKFMPLISPVMHRITISEHWFFVPNRLCWKDWDDWISGKDVVGPPTIEMGDVRQSENGQPISWAMTLGAYMGLPSINVSPVVQECNALPLAAYALIYNEYFIEQSVMGDGITVDLHGGLNAFPTDISIHYGLRPLPKIWRKDYFTAALPAAQKGAPIQIPLQGSDPLNVVLQADGTTRQLIRDINGNDLGISASLSSRGLTSTYLGYSGSADPILLNPNGTFVVDDSNAATINDFRAALALQAFLEKDNVGGQRYTEIIQAHFGSTPPDFRLQRPEYIGGNKQNVTISEVLSTAETVQDTSSIPIGQMAGHAQSLSQSHNMTYKATEHGFIFCLMCIEPDLNYINQGMHRKWRRFDRLDYAWPSFAHLGEQAILNREIVNYHTDPNGVFGYIPRYSEYKYAASRVSGEFSDTLAFWHLGQALPNDVALNSQFLLINHDTYDLTRIFAVDPSPSNEVLPQDYIVTQIFFDLSVYRALPRFSIPKLIG